MKLLYQIWGTFSLRLLLLLLALPQYPTSSNKVIIVVVDMNIYMTFLQLLWQSLFSRGTGGACKKSLSINKYTIRNYFRCGKNKSLSCSHKTSKVSRSLNYWLWILSQVICTSFEMVFFKAAHRHFWLYYSGISQ